MSSGPGQALEPVLSVRALRVVYRRGWRQPPVIGLDGVDIDVRPGETVGVVGESGSGKSTLGRAIVGLTQATSGHIVFGGEEITRASAPRRRQLTSDIQMIFQDPYSSLNPTKTIGATLMETLRAHDRGPRDHLTERIGQLLTQVGLPADAQRKYPRNFSGGQRQRIAIARALLPGPRLVVCDEPTSALDLSVQAQVLNLLSELQRDLGLSYLFISHDLAVVNHMCTRVVVLYHGRVMETGSADAVCKNPGHPYTQALLAAAPVSDPELRALRRGQRTAQRRPGGPAPSQAGCAFAERCPLVLDICRSEPPPAITSPGGGVVHCHRYDPADPPGPDRPGTTAPCSQTADPAASSPPGTPAGAAAGPAGQRAAPRGRRCA
jgi:oligopeptide/dipeptide ABC transporter ATP-binding protein